MLMLMMMMMSFLLHRETPYHVEGRRVVGTR